MPVVAVCSVHGAFPSRMFHIESSEAITLSGNFETCPQCGRQARIIDGTFDFNTQGLATILSAPGWSRRALRSVQGSIKEMAAAVERDDDQAFEQILQRLEQQDQQLAHLVTTGIANRPKPQAVVILTRILAVLGGIVTLRESGEISAETVRLLVERVFS